MDTIINLDEQLVHKGRYRDYLIATKDGWVKISGKPIKIKGAEAFEMFITGNKFKGNVSISEKTTGLGSSGANEHNMVEEKLELEKKLALPDYMKAFNRSIKTSPKAPYHLMNK